MFSFTPWYIILGEFGIELALGLACAKLGTLMLARGDCRRNCWRIVDFCLLRGRVLYYGSADPVILTVSEARKRDRGVHTA